MAKRKSKIEATEITETIETNAAEIVDGIFEKEVTDIEVVAALVDAVEVVAEAEVIADPVEPVEPIVGDVMVDVVADVIADVEEDPVEAPQAPVSKCECDGLATIVKNRLGKIRVCTECGLKK